MSAGVPTLAVFAPGRGADALSYVRLMPEFLPQRVVRAFFWLFLCPGYDARRRTPVDAVTTAEHHQEVRSMEPTPGRLTATLVAGKIPVTEEALTMLRAGLSTIGHGYRIEKAISETARTDTKLKNDLSRLHVGCRTVVDVLDTDLTGSGQIEAIFYDPWHGSQVPRLVEELRSLTPRIETALAMMTQSGAIKKRRQDPETWFFVAMHDLFSELTGDPEPGIAGPLHRFTKSCAALIDAGIAVPERENSFQKRLTAALARRTGKINVFPKVVFPGK
jgi:hypothetical protein